MGLIVHGWRMEEHRPKPDKHAGKPRTDLALMRDTRRYIFPDRVSACRRTNDVNQDGAASREKLGIPPRLVCGAEAAWNRARTARALRAPPSVSASVLFALASRRVLGQGSMCLMEPPECRYQFCRDSHDLAAAWPTGTLSEFIGRSVARKQSPSPPLSPRWFVISLCARILNSSPPVRRKTQLELPPSRKT